MEILEMSSLFGEFILNIVKHLTDKPNGLKHEIVLKGGPSGRTGVEVEKLQ